MEGSSFLGQGVDPALVVGTLLLGKGERPLGERERGAGKGSKIGRCGKTVVAGCTVLLLLLLYAARSGL